MTLIFEANLNALMGQVPLLLLELALVETLIRQWLRVPFETRGAILRGRLRVYYGSGRADNLTDA